VYPSLTYRDVGAALTWLAEAFGFEGHVLDEVSAIVRSGDGVDSSSRRNTCTVRETPAP